jgi:type IV pilus assembly protein PilW
MNNMRLDRKKRMAGFSLPELMIGITIGLITVLVIMQVLSVAESRKRTASGGADAVVNAALSLYSIERDARNAGYGISSTGIPIGCPVRAMRDATNVGFQLVPAIITDPGGGAPDSIRFLASRKIGITATTKLASAHANAGQLFLLESDLGFELNDLMLVVPAALDMSPMPINWCTLAQVTALGLAGANQVRHDVTPSPSLNQDPGASIMPVAGYATGDYLINLGSLSDHTYSIRNNNELLLTERNLTGATLDTPRVLYPHIVQLQAVYGKDTNADDLVDAWNVTPPATVAQWAEIRALRIAIVARSQYAEVGNVTLDGTQAASTCAAANPNPAAICWKPDPTANGVAIDVSVNRPDWQRFRYRVMETTVPLRNVIWQQ